MKDWAAGEIMATGGTNFNVSTRTVILQASLVEISPSFGRPVPSHPATLAEILFCDCLTCRLRLMRHLLQ
jgi:hypothetical protein